MKNRLFNLLVVTSLFFSCFAFGMNRDHIYRYIINKNYKPQPRPLSDVEYILACKEAQYRAEMRLLLEAKTGNIR